MTGEAEFDEVFFTDVRAARPTACSARCTAAGASAWRCSPTSGATSAPPSSGSNAGSTRWPRSAASRDLDAVERQRLVEPARPGHGLQGAWPSGRVRSASTAASLMKLGITEMLFDVAVLRGDARRRRRHARRTRRRSACWPRPAVASPAAPARCSATSSASASSACPASRRERADVDGLEGQRAPQRRAARATRPASRRPWSSGSSSSSSPSSSSSRTPTTPRSRSCSATATLSIWVVIVIVADRSARLLDRLVTWAMRRRRGQAEQRRLAASSPAARPGWRGGPPSATARPSARRG